MKKIKLPVSNSYTVDFSIKDLKTKPTVTLPNGKIGIHIGELGGVNKSEDLKKARENGAEVIWSTITIEKALEDIIVKYLFTIQMGIVKERDFFINEIIQNNIFSYNVKKQLALKIIQNETLITGKERNKLNKHLTDIMNYRNAFAHGTMASDVEKGVILTHFSSKTRRNILNDLYWSNLEEVFNNANSMLRKAHSKLIESRRDELIQPSKT